MNASYLVKKVRSKVIYGAIVALASYLTLSYSFNTPLSLNKTISIAEPKVNLEKLIEAANAEGKLIWYESSLAQQAEKIAAAFNKRYPEIKVEHVRLRGSDVGVRVLAESQAGATTADVAVSGLDTLMALNKRGVLERVKWTEELGVFSGLVEVPYAVASTCATYVLVYNTELISEADAPKNWEDVLNPKFKGKIGIWQRLTAFANLVPAWGEEKSMAYAKKIKEQNPKFYQSTFPLNAAVSAGEVSLGISIYHTAVPSLKKGAPIKIVFTNPTTITILQSGIPKKAAHPNAAKLFVAWLSSLEGALAYESATNRGNALLPGTKTFEMLKGVNLSYFPGEQAPELAVWLKKVEEVIHR
ncbi:MAG: extracellular solute-binding protein [Pseudomonadota bacterium]